MSGRAKGKRFVIRGKERLDVGLHEDEFLLQAVFFIVWVPARILTAGRPCWRLDAVKTLSHRRVTPTVQPKSRLAGAHVGAAPPAKPYSHRLATPTGRPKSCPAADHVGAAPPAKPYPTAGPRQQAGENPARRAPMLALPRRQSLIPPPDHANSLAQILSSGRPCWRGQAPARILFIRKFINQPFSFTS